MEIIWEKSTRLFILSLLSVNIRLIKFRLQNKYEKIFYWDHWDNQPSENGLFFNTDKSIQETQIASK